MTANATTIINLVRDHDKNAPRPAIDQTDIVRKRRFAVRSIEDVAKVLEQMRAERFQGFVQINISGGNPISAEAEERAKLETIDKGI